MNSARLPLLMLASLLSVPAHAVTIQMMTVGDPGNANDTTGYGGVSYAYQIGKYDVTISQYCAFLNAVAASDTYGLYNTSMATSLNVAGISRAGGSGSYTYSVLNNNGNSGNRPITLVSWFDAARFANWMANGQPTGAQNNATTENGTYSLNGVTSGSFVAKNATNPNTGAAPTYSIPTENEWYKAAYYSAILNSGSGGYWSYATQSHSTPGNVIGSTANQANFNNGVYSANQSAYSVNQNFLTDVGAFTNSASYYGTFDQSGNVMQWNSLDGTSNSAVCWLRGGSWNNSSSGMLASYRTSTNLYTEYDNIGFRLAAPAPVPEPSTWVMGLAGLACAAWASRRRRAA